MVRDDHVVVVGENRPRLYATMLAVQSLGAVPVPLYQDAATTEYVFPINNAEVRFAIVEDQEQVDKMIEVRESCPQLARIWYDDPRGLRNYDEPGLAALDALIEAGQAFDAAHAGFFDAEVAQGAAAGRGGDVLHQRHHRQPQGRGAHALHAARPRRRRRPLRQARPHRGGAGLPAAGLDRPEHLQLCAVAGLRLCRQLPGVGRDGDDRPQGDRPHLLLRAAAGLRGPADQRDDPHGGRRQHQEVAVPHLHGRGAARRPGTDGRQARRRRRPPAVCAGRQAHLRPAAQYAGLQPRARGLHRGRGHRPRPLHLLPLDRHQPQAALRQHRDGGLRLPAARQRGQGRHRRRADRGRARSASPTTAR